MEVLAINTNSDPWGVLIFLGILIGICGFPFAVGGITYLVVKAATAIFKLAPDAGFGLDIAFGFGAAAIEFFVLVVFVMPKYS